MDLPLCHNAPYDSSVRFHDFFKQSEMLSKHASSRGLEESVRHEGLVRKRGRLNTSFAERYFVLANGVDVFMCHTYLHTLCMCVSVCIWRGGYASREVKESCHT